VLLIECAKKSSIWSIKTSIWRRYARTWKFQDLPCLDSIPQPKTRKCLTCRLMRTEDCKPTSDRTKTDSSPRSTLSISSKSSCKRRTINCQSLLLTKCGLKNCLKITCKRWLDLKPSLKLRIWSRRVSYLSDQKTQSFVIRQTLCPILMLSAWKMSRQNNWIMHRSCSSFCSKSNNYRARISNLWCF